MQHRLAHGCDYDAGPGVGCVGTSTGLRGGWLKSKPLRIDLGAQEGQTLTVPVEAFEVATFKLLISMGDV
jgi:hypothetical protein